MTVSIVFATAWLEPHLIDSSSSIREVGENLPILAMKIHGLHDHHLPTRPSIAVERKATKVHPIPSRQKSPTARSDSRRPNKIRNLVQGDRLGSMGEQKESVQVEEMLKVEMGCLARGRSL